MHAPRLMPPAPALLPAYAAALEQGWSPHNLENVSAAPLAALRADPAAVLAALPRPGGPLTLPGGREVPRLPSHTFWIVANDVTFCGVIRLRWQPGTEELPPWVLGHVGYAIVPDARGRGLATWALGQVRPVARGLGLARIRVCCAADNTTSRRVIERNGGVLVAIGPEPGPRPEPGLRPKPGLHTHTELHFRVPT